MAYLITKFPNDPYVRGRFFKTKCKLNSKGKQLRRNLKKELLDKLDTLQSQNPKEFWEIVEQITEKSVTNQEFPDTFVTKLHNHFEKLNTQTWDDQDTNPQILLEIHNLESKKFPPTSLDDNIKNQEITEAINNLKNNKAAGLDRITNEMIKYGKDIILPLLAKLFNKILTTGIFPTQWTKGYVSPIHKKDDTLDPNNYRGITILSCLGKLFSTVLNMRLTNFQENGKTLKDNQSGFRKKRRTTDNMFILKTLINKYLNSPRKKLYLCFIDFQKAFDTVWHSGIALKLLRMGIGNRFYKIIKSMYENTKLCIKTNNNITDAFTSNIGIRQGDNISPTIFNIYLNDLEFPKENCDPATLLNESVSHLLWADDLLLISETSTGLQSCLNILGNYCKQWHLNINPTKSNVMIISKSKRTSQENIKFNLNEHEIAYTDKYTYLGCTLNYLGKFSDTKTDLYQKALKALFKIHRSFGGINPSPKIYNKLFDTLIKPIILYASEIWGVESISKLNKDTIKYFDDLDKDPPEKLHTKFCKLNLLVSKNTSNAATKKELGRQPLIVDINNQILKYWLRLENSTDNAILNDAYKCCQALQKENKPCWLTYPTELLSKHNLPNNKIDQDMIDTLSIKTKQNYETYCKSKIQTSEKLIVYKTIIDSSPAEYLDMINNCNYRKSVTKLRICAHRLEIETGRYKNIQRIHRTCKFCDTDAIEDEVHFICTCPAFSRTREQFFQKITNITPSFTDMNPTEKVTFVLSCNNSTIAPSIGRFCHQILSERKKLQSRPSAIK